MYTLYRIYITSTFPHFNHQLLPHKYTGENRKREKKYQLKQYPFSSPVFPSIFSSRRTSALAADPVDRAHQVRPGGHPAGQLFDTALEARGQHHFPAEHYDGEFCCGILPPYMVFHPAFRPSNLLVHRGLKLAKSKKMKFANSVIDIIISNITL